MAMLPSSYSHGKDGVRSYILENISCHSIKFRSLDMEELDMDGEKAARPEFAYPYCYEDHEVASLCAHVEEEHPLEWRYSLHNVLVQQSILDVQKSSVLG